MTEETPGFAPAPGEVDTILRRSARRRAWHAVATVTVVAAVASAGVVPRGDRHAGRLVPTSPSGSASPSASRPSRTTPAADTPSRGPAGRAPGASQVAGPSVSGTSSGPRCAAGANGGATDRGVTATQVRLFSTVVKSGIRATPFGAMSVAMRAVTDTVNRGGGICGRQLELHLVDDEESSDRGEDDYAFGTEDAFAIAVGASQPGLDLFAAHGGLERTRTPAVGLPWPDGAARGSRWAWPVAVSDAAAARIMVAEAYARGARTFGVVFDRNVAAAEAFDAEVLRLTTQHVAGYNAAGECHAHYCGTNRSPLAVAEFYSDPPDFVGLVDESGAGWLDDPRAVPAGDARVPYGYAALDTMRAHLAGCGTRCDGLRVWSAYRLPVGAYLADPAVRAYQSALGDRADAGNPYIAAAYSGTELLVAAIRACGPLLTRERLTAVLRDGPLAAPLTVAGTVRYPEGNRTMRAYDWTGGAWTLGPVGRDPG